MLAIAIQLALTAYVAAQAGPQPVRLADGDSFALGKERYRLYGIDAPELHQQCTDDRGRNWPCGTRARSELRRIIGTEPVKCRTLSTDRFGRNVAVCHAGGRDLAEEMVRGGFATVIERRDSNSYDAAQAEAQAEKRGLWIGTFDAPSEWRRAHPREDDSAPVIVPTPRDWLARKSAELWQALPEWLRSLFDP